jgi:hypothetical protein
LREKGREEELSVPQSDGEREATVEEWKLQSKVVQEADTAIAAAAVNPLTAQSINHSIPHSFFLCKSLCTCSCAGQAPPPCILHFAALLLLYGPVVVECELRTLMQRRSFATTPQFHKPRKQKEVRMSLKMDEHIWMRQDVSLNG